MSVVTAKYTGRCEDCERDVRTAVHAKNPNPEVSVRCQECGSIVRARAEQPEEDGVFTGGRTST